MKKMTFIYISISYLYYIRIYYVYACCNIASWHKNQSNSGVVFLSAAARPILHKPSSFPALHELMFANLHDLSLIIFLTLRMLFAYLHQLDFSQDRYLCESWLLLKHYIFQRLSIRCKVAQPATNN